MNYKLWLALDDESKTEVRQVKRRPIRCYLRKITNRKEVLLDCVPIWEHTVPCIHKGGFVGSHLYKAFNVSSILNHRVYLDGRNLSNTYLLILLLVGHVLMENFKGYSQVPELLVEFLTAHASALVRVEFETMLELYNNDVLCHTVERTT